MVLQWGRAGRDIRRLRMVNARDPYSRSDHRPEGRVRVVTATRCSELLDDLVKLFDGPGAPDVLSDCFLVVQGPGLDQWVRARMVDRLGAWGGVQSPFLRDFMLGLAVRAGEAPRVEPGRGPLLELGYRIAACIMQSIERAAPEDPIEPLLAMCRDERGTVSLASALERGHALARSFDRYEMDRPEMVRAWRDDRAWAPVHAAWGESEIAVERWQRALWRRVVPASWKPHEAWQGVRKLIDRLNRGDLPPTLRSIGLVSVFGVSSMPRQGLAMLEALAKHMPVHLHMLVPSHGFLERRAPRAQRAGEGDAIVGHPLVAAMAGAAVGAAEVLDGFDLHPGADAERPDERPETLLQCLQSSLRDNEPPSNRRSSDDGSVAFHGVASATRAAEVVHDEILAAFRDAPGGAPLRQEDVMILSADPATTEGPLRAVFEDRRRLFGDARAPQLRLADAAAGHRSDVATVLLRAMQVALEDQSFEAMRGVLRSPCCCAALEVDAQEMDDLLERLEGAGARRFVDASMRADWLGSAHADDALHTLDWAVDRVMLGMVVGDSPASQAEVGLLRPHGTMGAQQFDLLHGALRMMEAVCELTRLARAGMRPVAVWAECLARVCDATCPTGDVRPYTRQRWAAQAAIRRLREAGELAGLPPLAWSEAHREFRSALEALGEGADFGGGGIVMGRLMPMRSVPTRMLVLVGLDLGVFPGQSRRDVLDLTSLAPMPGDRDRRLDDQLVLLESLHVTADRLVVVVRDRDPASGEPVPLSPPMDELVATVAAHRGVAAAEARAKVVLHRAALTDQPEAWVKGGRVGFDRAARQRAEAVQRGRDATVARSFLVDASSPPSLPAHAEIPSIARLGSILRNPAREYLRAHGLVAAETARLVGERAEPFELSFLDAMQLDERVLQAVLTGEDREVSGRRATLEGDLPHGVAGQETWRRTWERFEASALQSMRTHLGESARAERLEFKVPDLEPELRCTTLWVPSIRVQVLVSLRPAMWLSNWCEHLAFSLQEPEGITLHINLVKRPSGMPPVSRLAAIEASQAIEHLAWLRALVGQASAVPLAFHGRAWALWHVADPRKPGPRLNRVRTVVESGDMPVSAEPPVRLLFRGRDLLAWGTKDPTPSVLGLRPSFEEIAEAVSVRMDATGWTSDKRGKAAGA
jgi:exodeoxyribonuclease V gamma subunit